MTNPTRSYSQRLRHALEAAFPSLGHKIKTDHVTGGSIVRVYWPVDRAPEQEVERVVRSVDRPGLDVVALVTLHGYEE